MATIRWELTLQVHPGSLSRADKVMGKVSFWWSQNPVLNVRSQKKKKKKKLFREKKRQQSAGDQITQDRQSE